ncbi:transcription factor IIIB 50 kDa subunit [Takifugu flavidus]|uniref:transcription factor IIIB 50 kDa subunit n=1 Tax=Takifugu flavidus TaxID=433684 RepID=UPI00254432A8|nr:transcription factor IIIB 50 kDa subunit [Takifugu flavidus]
MSAGSLRCRSCGSTNIIEDDLYAQTHLVCVDCGSVVSEGVLEKEPFGGSVVSYSQSTAVDKKPSRSLKECLQRVKAICRTLRVNNEIEELSQNIFNQAYQHRNYIRVSLQKKEILIGCCVIASCRIFNWPITMGTIGSLLDTDVLHLGSIYQEMVKILNIEVPSVSFLDEIEGYCQEYKISAPHVREELAENVKDMTKRTVALVELAADSWIVTGRRPVPIMMAATYLAWQSLRPNKYRLSLTLVKFCQIAKVKSLKPALKRVAEMKEVLCKLANEIPWLQQKVKPDNVLQQVEDILKYRFALLRRALRTHEEALLADREENTPPHIVQAEQQSPNASSMEQHELDSDLLGRPGNREDSVPTQPEQPGSSKGRRDPAENWGKRVLFAPPCVVHGKKRKVQAHVAADVTGDEEISDSEISSYIRSPSEVQQFALAQELLSESKDGCSV